jgi:hypothetical protein
MTDARTVTTEDIKLVHDVMVRRESDQLRVIGLAAEIAGWVTAVAGVFYGALQWDLLRDQDDGGFFGPVAEVDTWRQIATFVLPGMLNILVAGLLLVVVGRAARLGALHLAARRGLNLTGLELGEPLDVDVDLEEDAE